MNKKCGMTVHFSMRSSVQELTIQLLQLKKGNDTTDFNLWHSADFLPEEDPNDGELLLDELEQDNILVELLRNACLYTSQFCSYVSIHLIFLDRPECS